MIFKIPSLYFVTPEIGSDLLHWERVIKLAVQGGIDLVQIRDKTNPDEKIINATKRIQPFLKKHGIPLVINDRVDIASKLRADGVHLGQSDLTVKDARRILGKNAIIGLSVENMEQALIAEDVTYIAASPVFPTKTKRDCNMPWGLENLKKLCTLSSYPVVAIGGIRLNNVASILDAGAKGVAIITAIANSPCPKKAAQAFKEKMKI